MKFLTFFCLLCVSLSSYGQGGVRRVDTLSDLLTLDPRATAAGTKVSYEVGGRLSVGDWGQPRTAMWSATGGAATNSFFVFNGVYGQWLFNDGSEGYIRPEWSVGFSSGNATAALLEATRLASTNKEVLVTSSFDIDGITINSSVTPRINWRGPGSIGARENGQFGDAAVIRLRAGSNTNFITIDGNVDGQIRGITFNANKANQANTFPAIHVKGTSTYYSLLFEDVHVVFSKGDAFLNDSRPQVYFIRCGLGFNNGNGLTLLNTVDNIIDHTTIGKNLGSGLVASNFTTLRISGLDSFENAGHGVEWKSSGAFSSASYIKDSVINVNGKDAIRLEGSMGLLTFENILIDRPNADKITGFWTNGAASGTYSFISQYTNAAGQYPRDVHASGMKLGYAENASTLKPAYFLADYTGRKFTDWKMSDFTFVTYAGSPASGIANFNFSELQLDKYSFFSTSSVPYSVQAFTRGIFGSQTVNTNYPLVVNGKFMLQEAATPANQWVFDPDTTSGAIVFKDGVDGNPFFAMRRSGELESWSGGEMRVKVDATGVQHLVGGVKHFLTDANGVFITNRVSVNTFGNALFGISLKGPQLFQSTDGVSTHWWTLNPDAGGVNGLLGILDTIDGDPTIYLANNGTITFAASQGVALPVLSSTQESAVSAPSNGRIIYNSTLGAPRYYGSGTWNNFGVTLEQVQDDMSTFLVAGSGIGLSYDDAGNHLTINNTATSTVSVNGAVVSNPNFKNSATVTISVAGSDVTFAANGSTNASVVKVDGSNVNDPDFVDSAEINIGATGSSVSASLIAGSVGYSKIQNVTASRVLGRGNSGAGSPQELTLSRLTISGTTLSADLQKSTNLFVNGTEFVGVNLFDNNSIVWSVTSSSNVLATVKDADKGDITVSSSGTTFTVDNGAITYSKIQNVSANKLLGRRSGSGGTVEEITIGSGLSMSSGGTLSVSGAGSGISKFGTVKFRINNSYNIDNVTTTGNISALLNMVSGDSANPAVITVPFSSNAASTEYMITGVFVEDNDTTNRDQYDFKIRKDTKAVDGFTIEISSSFNIYAPTGVWVTLWVME